MPNGSSIYPLQLPPSMLSITSPNSLLIYLFIRDFFFFGGKSSSVTNLRRTVSTTDSCLHLIMPPSNRDDQNKSRLQVASSFSLLYWFLRAERKATPRTGKMAATCEDLGPKFRIKYLRRYAGCDRAFWETFSLGTHSLRHTGK